METHMSQIDDNNFNPPSFPHETTDDKDEIMSERDHRRQEFFHQQQQPPPHMFYPFNENPQTKKDIFTDVDKSVYIVIFIAFILGFFMGKTMQPVILRPM